MSGERAAWERQVNATLAELARRRPALEAALPAPGDRHHARLARAEAGLERHAARLDALERRGRELEAREEALDASFVRHQRQNEGDLERVERGGDRVRQELDHHLGDHRREGRR